MIYENKKINFFHYFQSNSDKICLTKNKCCTEMTKKKEFETNELSLNNIAN